MGVAGRRRVNEPCSGDRFEEHSGVLFGRWFDALLAVAEALLAKGGVLNGGDTLDLACTIITFEEGYGEAGK